MTSQGTKRKRDHESFERLMEFSPTTDMEIMELTKQLMKKVTSNEMYKPGTKKTIIGILGKSGEGKSSLINAILGKQYLLPSGCFGACTAVVTQVEANLDDSNYTAEIDLFSKKEWEKELKGLFRDIEDDSEERNEELIEIAVEKMTALYGPGAHKKTLKELKREAKFAEIERFLLENRKRISKNDVDEFACEIARYIQRNEASLGDWYWPLVKRVTIKIPDCRELLENIVLVDLPGTGDCNKIRNDLWKSKLSDCSSVWIVSDIKRAITDKDPWGILKHCIEELGPGGKCKSFKFICTKTDDINPVEYIRSGLFPTDQISADKNKKNACIPHRNGHAKMKVGEKFENSEIKKIFSTDNQFQVLTVSSNAFFDHSLNLESSETEIPKLQHELRILNKSIRRELTRDCVNEAKGFLLLIQSGHLDTDKKMIEIKDKVRKEFEKNLKKSLNDLEKYFDSINNDLKKCLSKGVDESMQHCVASIEAVIAPKNGRMYHQTLSALCRNYGCYRSKNWDVDLDLNKTLAKHFHQCTDEFFGAIFPVTRKNRRSLQEQIEMFSIVQIDSVSSRSPILHHIYDFIRIEETKLKALLNREIIDMKKDIYSSIQTTIERQICSCYEEAAAVRGKGSLKKKQDLLINTVNNIKHQMFNKAKAEALKRFNKLELHVKDTTKTRLNRAIKRSQSQTCKSMMDVSEEIKQLERYLEQLAD